MRRRVPKAIHCGLIRISPGLFYGLVFLESDRRYVSLTPSTNPCCNETWKCSDQRNELINNLYRTRVRKSYLSDDDTDNTYQNTTLRH